ncbi:MAG: membrane fusion protein (multidrug efflux system) [Oleiphilaceae bacterium]|jgi:membrane fusion protein (multidrug efflux system)
MSLFDLKTKVIIKNASLIVAAILLLVTQAHGQKNFTELPVAGYLSAQKGNSGVKFGDLMECLVEPYLIANVGSPVEGIIESIQVGRGDVVKKGQLIAKLKSSVEVSTLNLKQAHWEFGQRKVARNKELFNKNLISESEKDELITQTEIAKLEFELQQEIVNELYIKSPLTGVVLTRFLAPGEQVGQGKILSVAQLNPLNVEVVVPAVMFDSIKNGLTGNVSFASEGDVSHKATVVAVDPIIDAASRTFAVRLQLPNPRNKIPAGINCLVRFNK